MKDCKKCYNENICGVGKIAECERYIKKTCYNCIYECKVDREGCSVWERII